MEAMETTPHPHTLVSFIESVGNLHGVRLMRALRAADGTPRLHDPLATITSEFELRRLLNEDELHGAALLYNHLHPSDEPIVEGRENGIRVLNAFRRAMRFKLLPSAYGAYFRDAFAEISDVHDLRKNLNENVLSGARYVFDYMCPEECCGSPDLEPQSDNGRFRLRASMLNETDLALGWVTLLEFAAMRLVLRWSEMPSVLRAGDDEYPDEDEEEDAEAEAGDVDVDGDIDGNAGDDEGTALLPDAC